MAINQALLGHGMFSEFSIKNALTRYKTYASANPVGPLPKDDIDRFVLAMKDMDVRTVWIQLFSRGNDFDNANSALRQGVIDRLALAPNGRSVLSGSADKTLKLWDMASEAQLRVRDYERGGTELLLSMNLGEGW